MASPPLPPTREGNMEGGAALSAGVLNLETDFSPSMQKKMKILRKLHSYDHAPKPFVTELECRQSRVEKIPTRYLVGCGMNEREATRRWKATLDWRRKMGIDELLTLRFMLTVEDPINALARIKTLYPHGFHGRSKGGKPVYYDRPAPLNLKSLIDLTPYDGPIQEKYKKTSKGYRNVVRCECPCLSFTSPLH